MPRLQLQLLLLSLTATACCYGFDYASYLQSSFLFYEANRQGPLPPTQRVTWRGNSMMNDAPLNGVMRDLLGGYADAGVVQV
jgi:endoglucanase